MSSIYYEVFTKPGSAGVTRKLDTFLNALNESDWDAIKAMPEADAFDSVEEALEDVEIEHEVENGIYHLNFDSSSSPLIQEFFDFLQNLGVEEIEACVHDSQVVESYYYFNGEMLDSYDGPEWKYLEEE